MVQFLDKKTSDILNFQPKIEYIEPPAEPEQPHPLPEPIKDNTQEPEKLYNLANAVNVLGAALQARINERSKNIKIRLDPKVDAMAILALKRLFGKEDEQMLDNQAVYITYDQYRQCREALCNYGNELANNAMTTDDEIATAKAKLKQGLTAADLDGSLDGSLRPELSSKAQIIEPLDMAEFQAELIKLLIREIWKIMIYKPFKKLPVIGGKIPKNCPGIKLKKSFTSNIKKAKKSGVKVLGA